MIKIPPYLKPGDTIGITCPAGYMSYEKAATCISTLQHWGYKVKVGKMLGSESATYFSGSDEERLAEFQRFLYDDDVKAILCARGGYGTSRIIDRINFKKFKKKPKWIIGYSDITVLHSHIYVMYKTASLHAPMAGAFNEGVQPNEAGDKILEDQFIRSLKNTLEGKKQKYSIPAHEFNKKGEAVGELVGGNLSLLAHLTGTVSDIKTKGRILFIEDIGEQLYSIDRMVLQIKRSGKLDKLAGLIVGGFNDLKDTERPFGKTAYALIRDAVKEFDYPVCFGFPVSHGKENYAFKVGAGYKLRVGKSKVVLEE